MFLIITPIYNKEVEPLMEQMEVNGSLVTKHYPRRYALDGKDCRIEYKASNTYAHISVGGTLCMSMTPDEAGNEQLLNISR